MEKLGKRLIFLVIFVVWCTIPLLGISVEERDGQTIYILSQEELDQTIIKAEQAKKLQEELQNSLVDLKREQRWRKFTLSFTLPVAGYLVLREVNPEWGPVVGVVSGAALAWVLNLLFD